MTLSKKQKNEIVECCVIPRDLRTACGDIIAKSRNCIGIVDGSTVKSWHTSTQPLSTDIAQKVAETLTTVGIDDTLEIVVERASKAISQLKAGHGDYSSSGPCATFAAAHLVRREVWRVGDCWVRIAAKIHPPKMWPDHVVALARTLILRANLAKGHMTVKELMLDDPGRDGVTSLLFASEALRNCECEGGYGAVDGSTVPAMYLERWSVDKGKEVVLATDGYLDISGTMNDAEMHLNSVLANDPLLIGKYRQTKTRVPGANSFDDRAYVRLIMP